MSEDYRPVASSAADEKTRQEIKNLSLTEEKLRQELSDLRRPYLLRNPQLLTALIASIGAIIGAFILIGDNYYKTREQLNKLQSEETRRIADGAQKATDAAQKATDAARKVTADAAAATAFAAKAKSDADTTISESNRQVRAAKDELVTTRTSLGLVEKERQSIEFAAKAEELLSAGRVGEAQHAAAEAWHLKHTALAQKGLVDAYSFPVALMQADGQLSYQTEFSPDGRFVVTSGADNKVGVWEALTGKNLAQMSGHTKTISSVMFSSDGNSVVTASQDHTVRIWDAHTGMQLKKIDGSAVFESAIFSPDGKWLFTTYNSSTNSSGDRTLIWDASTGKPASEIEGHSAGDRSMFSPDGLRVVTVSGGHKAWIWEISSGKRLATIEGHFDDVWAAKFSPDGGRVLTASNDGTVGLWNSSTGKELVKIKYEATNVAFSPDGLRVITGGDGGDVRIWDASTGKRLLKLDANGSVAAIFSLDGRRVLAAGDGSAGVWEAAAGKQIATLKGHRFPYTALFSPDGNLALLVDSTHMVMVYRIVTSANVERLFR